MRVMSDGEPKRTGRPRCVPESVEQRIAEERQRGRGWKSIARQLNVDGALPDQVLERSRRWRRRLRVFRK
jgi:hypothetical protein